MRMRATVLIMAIGLSACGASRQDEAEAIAARDLADPEAAQFRSVEALGKHCFTGELNAKNRMGAYTGYRPFIVDMRKGEVAIVPDPPINEPRDDDAIAQARVEIFRDDCAA